MGQAAGRHEAGWHTTGLPRPGLAASQVGPRMKSGRECFGSGAELLERRLLEMGLLLFITGGAAPPRNVLGQQGDDEANEHQGAQRVKASRDPRRNGSGRDGGRRRCARDGRGHALLKRKQLEAPREAEQQAAAADGDGWHHERLHELSSLVHLKNARRHIRAVMSTNTEQIFRGTQTSCFATM